MRTEEDWIFAKHRAAEAFFCGDDSNATFDGQKLDAQMERPTGWPFGPRG